MSTQQTLGPWGLSSQSKNTVKQFDALGETSVIVASATGYTGSAFFPSDEEAAMNARLIAAAPELLEEIESLYTWLADFRHEWPGRNMPGGQLRLGRMRDIIAKATGRSAQEVQDDYGTRAARSEATGAA